MRLAADVRVELVDLVHRYAACVDDRDLAGAAALFATDGVLVRPDPPTRLDAVHELVGRASIEEGLATLREVPVTVHEIVGTVLDPVAGLDGRPDAARGRIACVAHHVTRRGDSAGDLVDLVWHLRYLDAYTPTPQGWRFGRRELHVDLIETRPVRRARTESASPSRSKTESQESR